MTTMNSIEPSAARIQVLEVRWFPSFLASPRFVHTT